MSVHHSSLQEPDGPDEDMYTHTICLLGAGSIVLKLAAFMTEAQGAWSVQGSGGVRPAGR